MNGTQGLVLLTLCGIGLALALSNQSKAPKSTGREICNGVTSAQISEVMKIGGNIGLFPGRIGEETEVDERVWAEIPRDSKTAAALALYCNLGPGKTYLSLRGWRDGEQKASIINGSYWD